MLSDPKSMSYVDRELIKNDISISVYTIDGNGIMIVQ